MEGSQEINDEEQEMYDENVDVDEGDEGEFEGEESYVGSEPQQPGGIYTLFQTILNKPHSTKVSNLNKEELGDLGMSVRDSMRIALLAQSFGHPKFANFFLKQAGIISDSAMSKDGWFTEIIVTSKRYASRESSSNVKTLPQYNKGKWKMFSAKKPQYDQR